MLNITSVGFSNMIMDGLLLVMNIKVNNRLASELERERFRTKQGFIQPQFTKGCQTFQDEVSL